MKTSLLNVLSSHIGDILELNVLGAMRWSVVTKGRPPTASNSVLMELAPVVDGLHKGFYGEIRMEAHQNGEVMIRVTSPGPGPLQGTKLAPPDSLNSVEASKVVNGNLSIQEALTCCLAADLAWRESKALIVRDLLNSVRQEG